MTNAYISLPTLKDTLGITGTGDDAALLRMIEEISRKIDGHCGRVFYRYTATRYFSGNDGETLLLPEDLIAVTTLKEDVNGDATYGTAWATTDYELYPYEAEPTGAAGLQTVQPYWKLEVNRRSNGTKTRFGQGQKRFELAGRWGYSESKRASGSLLNGAVNASTTTFTVDDGTDFEVGQTIVADSEQSYITAIAAQVLTVERGVNGTTAAAHDDDTAVSIIEYPPDVAAAVLIEASRRVQMAQAHFSSQIGVPETGEVRVLGGGLRHETMEHLEHLVRRVFA